MRHPDHATIVLPDWHQVLMNRENNAPLCGTLLSSTDRQTAGGATSPSGPWLDGETEIMPRF